jgi:hypothetical protein
MKYCIEADALSLIFTKTIACQPPVRNLVACLDFQDIALIGKSACSYGTNRKLHKPKSVRASVILDATYDSIWRPEVKHSRNHGHEWFAA